MIVRLTISTLYSLPRTVDPWEVPFILSYGLVLAITAVALTLRRRWPCIQAVWVTYVVILLPVLGIVQNGPQIAADRYTYLAGLGWALLAGACVLACWRTWRRPLAGIALCVIATWGALTWNQVHIWHDSERLWTHVLAVEPGEVVAENNLGVELDRRGTLAEAVEHFEHALRLKPDLAIAHANWGLALTKQRKPSAAIEHFQRALSIQPDLVIAQVGLVLAVQGKMAEVRHYHLAQKVPSAN